MRFYNEPMSKHTTFKIGGPVEVLSIPDCEENLLDEIKYCQENMIPFRILGGGSNILVRDTGINDFVIKNTKACSQLSVTKSIVEVGSSVRLQEFIRFCVNHDLEGLEYLYSVPGTIGGAIYGNAGRGKKHKSSISDKLLSVRIYNGERIRSLNREECKFGYRSSIFQKKRNWVILGAKFELMEQDKETGEMKIKQRLNFVNESQDLKYPNAGSIFREYGGALKLMMGKQVGKARFSPKTINWISNLGGAKAKDVIKLINYAKIIQILTLKRPNLEIEIW